MYGVIRVSRAVATCAQSSALHPSSPRHSHAPRTVALRQQRRRVLQSPLRSESCVRELCVEGAGGGLERGKGWKHMVGSSPSATAAARVLVDASRLEGRSRTARVIPTTSSSLSPSRRSSFVSGDPRGLPGRCPARRRRARLPPRAAGGGGGGGVFGDWLRPLEGLVQKMGVTIYQVSELRVVKFFICFPDIRGPRRRRKGET